MQLVPPTPLVIKVIHAYYKANKLLKILEESIGQWDQNQDEISHNPIN